MTIFFTSDLHFGHKNIIQYSGRPYQDVNEMREILILNWNSVVKPINTIFILGDVVMGQREDSLTAISRLNGVKFLIPGNHDDCHPMYRDKKAYMRKLEMYEAAFGQVYLGDAARCAVDDEMYNLSHFPYRPQGNLDHQGRDFSPWQREDDGTTLLCGHVHEKWAEKKTDKGTLMINVGVDVRNYTPISLDQIRAIASQ